MKDYLSICQDKYENALCEIEALPDFNDSVNRTVITNEKLRQLVKNRSDISYCQGFFFGYACALMLNRGKK